MSEHDKVVLEVARKQLKEGCTKVGIGGKVISHREIVATLQKEFPEKKVYISR